MTTLVFCLAVTAQVIPSPSGYSPKVEADDGKALQAKARIKVPDGMVVELFAAEPHCANLVALDLAPDGSCYVVETFRRDKQVLDMREWPEWVEDDLAARTVADRYAMVMKRAKDPTLFRKESERVRLMKDRDGDGRVDWSRVFADGFNEIADGVAAGVLWRNGDVYFTDMPNLWRLRDRDGDGHAEQRTVLSTGYGVHYAFVGHDLHGLRMGPDGRLYFSCGDRGLDVFTKEGNHLELPDCGAVLRCEPDGSNLELWHVGLRNPQELQFDEFGDLFTVDNNSDGGDQARLVHVVEGGDSGWRLGWQWVGTPTPRSAWNGESMWRPAQEGQPNWIVPCVRNLVSGPSGLTRDPSGLLPGEFAGAFLICDFEAQWDNTRVVAFKTGRRGASHAIEFEKAFVERGIVATDVEFGSDGAVYVCDWVEGWEQTGRGRVWRIHDPIVTGSAEVRVTRELMKRGFVGRSTGELAQLLAHRDQRVRQEAQFELAASGAVDLLRTIVHHGADAAARRHATWALCQIARNAGGGGSAAATKAQAALLALLNDPDAERREQAAKGLGEASVGSAVPRLIGLLGDAEPRVRYFAAIALARMADPRAIEPLMALAHATGDGDRTLRHAAVVGLAGCADAATLAGLSAHGSAAVRMAALLALRRSASPAIGQFLTDSDRTIVVEAARAIHDLPLTDSLPALARLLDDPAAKELPLLRRAVNAAFRLGGVEQAQRLAGAAADRSDLPEEIRADAMRALAEFDAPPARDLLLGSWRPCPPRDPVAVAAIESHVVALLRSPQGGLAEATARFVERRGLRGAAEALVALARDESAHSPARVAAQDAIAAIGASELRAVIEATLHSTDVGVRSGARRHLARFDPQSALVILIKVLERASTEFGHATSGHLEEQQYAYATLGEMGDARAAELLALELGRLLDGKVAPEAALDLLLAARRKTDHPLVLAQLAKHAASKPADDKVAVKSECARGGDARRGRELFFERTEWQCAKCHRVGASGAGEAGPDLAGVAARLTPEQLLEAVLAPNRGGTAGYAATTLILVDGRILDGRIIGETESAWRLATLDQGHLEVLKAGVKTRREGLSAMPEDIAAPIEPRDLRDLIAFLAAQK
ncbi:MAG: c-type cytochrome [Planctomycetes bacterium]|nr:c-type cytochrome [Planctomycetota bacterium]